MKSFWRSWWKIGLVIGMLLAGLLLAVTAQQEIPTPTDTIISTTIPGWDSMDPAYAYDTASGTVLFHVYENLIDYDGGSTAKFKPMLATVVPSPDNGLITVAKDGTTYIDFPIREGVHFQNGDLLTAEDVAYSFQRLVIQDTTAGPQWMFDFPLFGQYTFLDVVAEEKAKGVSDEEADYNACMRVKDAIKVVSEHQVEFKLPTPVPYFLSIIAHSASWGAILDKSWVVGLGGWDGDCSDWRAHHDPAKEDSEIYSKTNGTGPWILESLDPTAGYTLVRNDNYWNKEAYPAMFGENGTKRVVVKYVEEWADRRLPFEKGDTDLVYVPRQYKDQVWGTSGARTVGFLPSGLDATIFFNYDIPTEGNKDIVGSGKLDGDGIPGDFFLDKNVRLGFEYSFDWDTFIKDAWLGEAVQARGPIVNSVPYYNPDQAVYHLDLEKATAYFKKAFDGKLWDVGFKMTIEWNCGNDQRKTASSILSDNLRAINPKFIVNLKCKPWGAGYLDDYKARKLALFIIGWLWDYPDADDWATPYMQSAGTFGGRVSISKLPNSKLYDQLIAEGATTLDPAKRKEIYYKLQKLAYDDAIAIFLVDATARHWERTWVNGWQYNAIWPGANFSVLTKKIGGEPNYDELLTTLAIPDATITRLTPEEAAIAGYNICIGVHKPDCTCYGISINWW